MTTSSEHAFQSPLKSKRHLVQQRKQATDEGATVSFLHLYPCLAKRKTHCWLIQIKEKCPKCGNDEMVYHTMQLRSADEGQTVFYNCKKCGYGKRGRGVIVLMMKLTVRALQVQILDQLLKKHLLPFIWTSKLHIILFFTCNISSYQFMHTIY